MKNKQIDPRAYYLIGNLIGALLARIIQLAVFVGLVYLAVRVVKYVWFI